MRREWIEMCSIAGNGALVDRLPPCGGSGLKFRGHRHTDRGQLSPSMRREWIEIHPVNSVHIIAIESPSMRREWIEMVKTVIEHVSRNCLPPCGGSGLKYKWFLRGRRGYWSPSMRREWIEIDQGWMAIHRVGVSLHAEGVD